MRVSRVQILMYGFCSALVGPFAFNASLVDMPMAFLLGLPVGYMQLVAAAESNLYANVFEVTMAIFTSFLARAIDSARSGSIFCFSALAQSSIVLILPGYTMCTCLRMKDIVRPMVRLGLTGVGPQCALPSSSSRRTWLPGRSGWCTP